MRFLRATLGVTRQDRLIMKQVGKHYRRTVFMIPSVNIEIIGSTTLHVLNTVVFHFTCFHISLLEKEVWADQGKDG
jgi:hypothetical protein